MSEQRPLKIFLCHAKADKPAARKIYRYLRSKGMAPWLDAENLLPGQNWQVEIPKALYGSDVILIFLSKDSITKEGYVQKEIKFALDKTLEMPEGRIFLIPARLEECDIPESLKNYQWVDLFEKNWNRRLTQSLNERAAQLGVTQSHSGTDESQPSVFVSATAESSSSSPSRKTENPVKAMSARRKPAPQEDGSVDIGGDAKGTTIITGDNNVIVQSPSGDYEAAPNEEEISKRPWRDRLSKPLGLAIGLLVFLFTFWLAASVIEKIVKIIPTPTILPTALSQPTDVENSMAQFASQTAAVRTASALSVTSTFTLTPNSPTSTATLGVGSTRISEKDGMTMVFIPPGQFNMGSASGNKDEQPIHAVYLDSYWMDQTEVTNKMYALCVDAGFCEPPTSIRSSTNSVYYGNPQFNDYPVIYVSWFQAQSYCGWAGRRLPTEAEWEKAARGTDGRVYPWGEGSSCDQANHNVSCIGDTTEIGNYPSGQSPYKIFDMAGNVWEWVLDWYDSDQYVNSVSRNPQGPATGKSRVFRGGSWNDDNDYLRSALRGRGTPSYTSNVLGFRCAVSE